ENARLRALLQTQQDTIRQMAEYNRLLSQRVAAYASEIVNATMFDRYLPFSCPLNTFVTDAVRFAPFHHH
ncbi:hypothetical protein, partial [Escherichia coli]|uniref:hypothetical protein n=1 Tax=Escherichia coli TaxID=562 RepID=UPI0015C53608